MLASAPTSALPAATTGEATGGGAPADLVAAVLSHARDHAVTRGLQQRQSRLSRSELELHPDKTRIVYCGDSRCRGTYEEISFTFCGYTFRPRTAYNKRQRESSRPSYRESSRGSWRR
jgi:hypothetical protein